MLTKPASRMMYMLLTCRNPLDTTARQSRFPQNFHLQLPTELWPCTKWARRKHPSGRCGTQYLLPSLALIGLFRMAIQAETIIQICFLGGHPFAGLLPSSHATLLCMEATALHVTNLGSVMAGLHQKFQSSMTTFHCNAGIIAELVVWLDGARVCSYQAHDGQQLHIHCHRACQACRWHCSLVTDFSGNYF